MFYGRNGFTTMDTTQADLFFNTSGETYGALTFSSGDMNNDGYTDLAASDHRYNSNQGAVYVVTPPHGTPTISVNTPGLTNNLAVTGTVSDTLTVGGVEVEVDNNNTWISCSGTSAFSCPLPSSLSNGTHSLRLRSKNSLGVYMATREYVSTSINVDTVLSTTFNTQGGDNIFTDNQLPTFTFDTSTDSSGISKYQVIVDNQVYIDNINPLKPENSNTRDESDKYTDYQGSVISVRLKQDKDKLENNKAYKWKVMALDNAGNGTSTSDKILRINTHTANFSNSVFSFGLISKSPTFVGIAPIDSKVTLRIEKDNQFKTGRDLVFSSTVIADKSSRFNISTPKLDNQDTYYVNLSAVNTSNDYTEIPEFKMNTKTSPKIKTKPQVLGDTTVSPTPTLRVVKPKETTPTPPQVKTQTCILWWCW